MDAAIVIHGVISERQFVADEPLPDVEGPAELIVYPKDAAKPVLPGKSMFEFLARLRNCDRRRTLTPVREERDAWGD